MHSYLCRVSDLGTLSVNTEETRNFIIVLYLNVLFMMTDVY